MKIYSFLHHKDVSSIKVAQGNNCDSGNPQGILGGNIGVWTSTWGPVSITRNNLMFCHVKYEQNTQISWKIHEFSVIAANAVLASLACVKTKLQSAMHFLMFEGLFDRNYAVKFTNFSNGSYKCFYRILLIIFLNKKQTNKQF